MSGKVSHSITLETANCSSSSMAEKDAFVICLNAAQTDFSQDSPLETVTTDGNVSIKSYIANQTDVIHALDIWHLCKNLAKNLANKCKRVVSILICLMSVRRLC